MQARSGPGAPEPPPGLAIYAPGGGSKALTGGGGAVETLDFDKAELAGAALREARGAGVAGQHVGIAVHAERHLGRRVLRVVPRAGRQLHDTRASTPR